MWQQPLDPLHSVALSALLATVPLLVVLVLMGGLRKSGLLASGCGLAVTGVLAVLAWRMPVSLAFWSVGYGVAVATWSVLWIVFNGLWLYNLSVETGKFDQLRRWVIEHASTDSCVQVILVAFCFGALLEGSAGFGAPVAITACLLVQLGVEARRAVIVALVANTAPVAFGGLGIPIVVLDKVTGLGLGKLSAMVGRQLPFLSLILPAYLACLVAGRQGLRRTWPAALVAGASFALTQFLVSNFWQPYPTDVVAALVSMAALAGLLRVWTPSGSARQTQPDPAPAVLGISASQSLVPHTFGKTFGAWLPWAMLSLVMVAWSWLELFNRGAIKFFVPHLHNGVWITLYGRSYEAVFTFQPLAGGTAVWVATLLTAAALVVRPKGLADSAVKTLRQLALPALTVLAIVSLAYLYNYSGMAYTLGNAVARVGAIFPLISSYLGWVACFLSGSDTASNLLFGNLQVAVAQQLHLNPVLLAATNSSGAVAGKMISPQNIAIGVTTVGLIGQEGKVLHSTFWHSVLMAAFIGLVALAQAYLVPGMLP
jgi:lactate permease